MWETWVWSLGWENPLEKGKATHSSSLAWRIPWPESMGSQRIGHGWAVFTFTLGGDTAAPTEGSSPAGEPGVCQMSYQTLLPRAWHHLWVSAQSTHLYVPEWWERWGFSWVGSGHTWRPQKPQTLFCPRSKQCPQEFWTQSLARGSWAGPEFLRERLAKS